MKKGDSLCLHNAPRFHNDTARAPAAVPYKGCTERYPSFSAVRWAQGQYSLLPFGALRPTLLTPAKDTDSILELSDDGLHFEWGKAYNVTLTGSNGNRLGGQHYSEKHVVENHSCWMCAMI